MSAPRPVAESESAVAGWAAAAVSSVAVGGSMIVQANLNIALGTTLGSPIRSACVSFCVGFIFISLILVAQSTARSCNGTAERGGDFSVLELVSPAGLGAGRSADSPEVSAGSGSWRLQAAAWARPRYYHGGGLLGAFYILMTVLIIPHLGFSLFYVFLVAGQLVAAILMDLSPRALLGQPPREVPRWRYAGCALTLLGVAMRMAVFPTRLVPAWMLVTLSACSLLSGAALPVQAAVNNALRDELHWSTFLAVRFSFGVGAAALAVLSALSFLVRGPTMGPVSCDRWFEWCGGMIGILYLAAGVEFSRIVGYSMFFICIITGQLGLSLISDMYGVFGPVQPSAGHPLSICGVACAVAGAAVVSAYSRPAPSAAHSQGASVEEVLEDE